MVPEISVPPGRAPARRWIVDLIMGRMFERWTYRESPGAHWRISLPAGGDGVVVLFMPDSFLGMPDGDWLSPRSLPRDPMAALDAEAAGLASGSRRDTIPVLFGTPTYRRIATGRAELGADLFGSAFFMLSRYEEAVVSTRDQHGRFPAGASIAGRNGFLARPIVDEYVELLWTVLSRLVPQLKRRPHRFRIAPSHDVDEPSRVAFRGLYSILKESAGNVVKRCDIRRAAAGPWQWMHGQRRLHPADEYNTFERLMDVSDAQGATSTFFFMAGASNPTYDRRYRLRHSAIRNLLLRVHRRGHLIGLHASYETYRDPSLLKQEASSLRDTLRHLGILQERVGARMHYLRWSLPYTWRALMHAGLDFDASVGFADMPGFRCGTCHEYRAFDVLSGQPIELSVKPLVAMDVTVMGEKYLGLGTSQQAHALLRELRERCKEVGGEFSLLWHNSEFTRPGSWDLYRCALGANPTTPSRSGESR